MAAISSRIARQCKPIRVDHCSSSSLKTTMPATVLQEVVTPTLTLSLSGTDILNGQFSGEIRNEPDALERGIVRGRVIFRANSCGTAPRETEDHRLPGTACSSLTDQDSTMHPVKRCHKVLSRGEGMRANEHGYWFRRIVIEV